MQYRREIWMKHILERKKHIFLSEFSTLSRKKEWCIWEMHQEMSESRSWGCATAIIMDEKISSSSSVRTKNHQTRGILKQIRSQKSRFACTLALLYAMYLLTYVWTEETPEVELPCGGSAHLIKIYKLLRKILFVFFFILLFVSGAQLFKV